MIFKVKYIQDGKNRSQTFINQAYLKAFLISLRRNHLSLVKIERLYI